MQNLVDKTLIYLWQQHQQWGTQTGKPRWHKLVLVLIVLVVISEVTIIGMLMHRSGEDSPTSVYDQVKQRDVHAETKPTEITKVSSSISAIATQQSTAGTTVLAQENRKHELSSRIDKIIPPFLQKPIAFLLEVYFMILFPFSAPLRRISVVSGRMAYRAGRLSTASTYFVGSLSVLRRMLLRTGKLLMGSRLGRIIARPFATLGKAIKKIYQHRSKLSVATEVTYYADLPTADDEVVDPT